MASFAGPPGPGRDLGGAVGRTDPRARAAQVRPHGVVGVRLLPWRRRDHGGRPRRDGHLRAPRAAVRRRPPAELRPLRNARTLADLRPERFRRDAPGPVRVGREAARGELRDRGTGARPHRRRARGGGRRDRARLSRGDAGVRRTTRSRGLVRAPARRGTADQARRPRRLQDREGGQARAPEGAAPEPPAGLRTAPRERRRGDPVRERASVARPGRGTAGSGSARPVRGGDPLVPAAVSREPAPTPAFPRRAVPVRPHRPQGRRGRKRGDPCVGRPDDGP